MNKDAFVIILFLFCERMKLNIIDELKEIILSMSQNELFRRIEDR
jgi:hypothetical protein